MPSREGKQRDADLQRTFDIQWVREVIGAHLGFNPWHGHWRAPTQAAAEAIVDRYAKRDADA